MTITEERLLAVFSMRSTLGPYIESHQDNFVAAMMISDSQAQKQKISLNLVVT